LDYRPDSDATRAFSFAEAREEHTQPAYADMLTLGGLNFIGAAAFDEFFFDNLGEWLLSAYDEYRAIEDD